VLERVEDRLTAHVEAAHQLRQLRDRHAVVGHPLEMEVDPQNREHQAEVDRDRRLTREQRLHALLDPGVADVDLVVEPDHLVGELVVAAGERVQCRAQDAEDERALLLQIRLEALQLLVKALSHPRTLAYPKRPVTYPSVRLSAGCVKIFSVESYSTRIP